MCLAERLAGWRRSRNWVAVGNLGEQVTLRLLRSLGYQVLGTQDDYLGMVSEVLGVAGSAHPEDFIAIDPDGRLVTVNSKATATTRTCRITSAGNLSAPQVRPAQRRPAYTTLRASLVSPLEGDSFAQAVKVDLLNQLAQRFEITGTGRLSPLGKPIDVSRFVAEALADHPHAMPPPATG